MGVRIASMILRLAALVAIVLGILFWTGNADALRQVHMTAGILVVLALLYLAVSQASKAGAGAVIAAVVVAMALPVVGITQEHLIPGPNHWLIQLVHLALALAAVGLGEMIAGRARAATRAA